MYLSGVRFRNKSYFTMTRFTTLSASLAALVLGAGFIVPAVTFADNSALTFTTAPTTNVVTNNKTEFVVQAPDSDGHTVALSDGNNGGVFYGASITNGCTSNVPVTDVTIASSASQKAFCYSNATAGVYTITASTDGLTAASSDVTVEDASDSTVTVGPGSLNGWYFYDDQTDVQLSDSADHGFVVGPDTPLLGTGSVHLTKTTNDKYGIATAQFAGTALSDITALSYSTYRASGTTAQVPSLGFDVDSDTTDADTSYQGRLTYEPYFTHTVDTGTWQTWNTQDDAASGNWWFSHSTLSDGTTSVCTQSDPCTWSELVDAYPNASISGQFILRTNGATNEAFDGNVDNLTMGLSGVNTVYDFDPLIETTVSDGSVSSLQSALDNTISGGTVYLSGDYSGSDITINHPVTLTAADGASPTFTGKITINSDDVTVSGLDITNPNAGYGVVVQAKSNVKLQNNKIHDIGTNLTEGSAQAIYLDGGSAGASIGGDSFTGNEITNVGTTTLAYGTSGSAKGIFVGDSDGSGAITGLNISGNKISDIYASTTPWDYSASPVEKKGRGAYGVLINYGANSTGSTEATITGNTIKTLSGLWAHAIGLEGDTPSTSVTGNIISGLSDNKSNTDAVAVKFEDNPDAASVDVSGNTLDDVTVTNSTSTVLVDGTLSGTDDNTEVHVDGGVYYYGQNAFSTVLEGVSRVAENGTVSVAPGDYNLQEDHTISAGGQTGWYLPIVTNGITLRGINASGNAVTSAGDVSAYLYSTDDTANGAWATQDLVGVFGNDVTIQGLGIMLKLSPNKGIEVIGANGFTAKNNAFSPIPARLYADIANYTDSTDHSTGNDISQFGSGIYFNNNSVTSARTATVQDNTFTHSRISFNTLGNHWAIDISGNTFDGNAIWGGYYPPLAFSVGTDFTGSTIAVNDNSFLNMATDQPIAKFYSGISGIVDATQNYWGSASGPTTEQIIENSGTINTTPWYTDDTFTTLDTGTPAVSGGEASTTVPVAINQNGTSTQNGSVGVSVTIPAGTVITGDSSWDGTLEAPTASTTALSFTGLDTTIGSAITIGSNTTDLVFSKPVKLVFAGQTGKQIGWYNHAGTFTEITDTCDGAGTAQVGGVDLATTTPGASCKHDDSGDLVVWTTHFSTFVTYSSAPTAPVLSPNGSVFHGSQDVTMDYQTGTSIRYTTDGSDPTCSTGNGYSDGQVLTFSDSKTLKAVRCAVIGGTTVSSSVVSANYSPAAGGCSSSGGGSSSGSGSTGGSSAGATGGSASGSTGAASGSTGGSTGSTGGAVLGAATYNFTKNLSYGSTGADVEELQKFLITEGFDIPLITKSGVPYGFFGPETKAATIAYQKAHNITPAVGFFGPITRGEVNKGVIATTPEHTTNLTTQQAQSILSLLESFNADASVIAKVKASLGL